MGNVAVSEMLIIFLVVLLVFGAKRIPDIARGLGQALREFRQATREVASELQIDEAPRPASPRPAPPAVSRPDPVPVSREHRPAGQPSSVSHSPLMTDDQ